MRALVSGRVAWTEAFCQQPIILLYGLGKFYNTISRGKYNCDRRALCRAKFERDRLH